jgi:TonB family protein
MLLEPDETARLAATGRLSITGRQLSAELTLADMGRVNQVLDQCNRDLLDSWGFGAEAQQWKSFAEPERPLYSYFRADDYPSDAEKSGASGTAEVRVTVEPNGRASECKVLRSAGHKSLDQVTCEVMMKRVRYTPARDGAGKALRSPALGSAHWQLVED